MSEQNHTPAKIQQRDKGKLKEEKDNTATSKRMNSKSTVDDHTNESMIIRPGPLKYTKVSILPSHLKLKRKKNMTNRESKITE
ncbi:MAG TPA: hypothetical protein VK553_03645 [Candidatus Nitrosopolaris rasttigaisensis]|jgi:hypothetical protein|nr:hypothetical protein [Candidatus Nitrosopolaris rasttigaisensis]